MNMVAEEASKYKLRFLGMKWRFLRFDLESETFPPLRPGADTQKKVEEQSDLEQSVVLETFERGLNLSQSISVSFPHESTVSVGPVCAMSEVDSVFTEEDVMMGIRNMQLFRTQEPINPVLPSAARRPAEPTPALAFSPRPPAAARPSDTAKSILAGRNSSKHSRPGRRRAPQAPSLQEQLQSLDIGRDFKLYAIENGVRVPDCVKNIDVSKPSNDLDSPKSQSPRPSIANVLSGEQAKRGSKRTSSAGGGGGNSTSRDASSDDDDDLEELRPAEALPAAKGKL